MTDGLLGWLNCSLRINRFSRAMKSNDIRFCLVNALFMIVKFFVADVRLTKNVFFKMVHVYFISSTLTQSIKSVSLDSLTWLSWFFWIFWIFLTSINFFLLSLKVCVLVLFNQSCVKFLTCQLHSKSNFELLQHWLCRHHVYVQVWIVNFSSIHL